MIYIDILEAFIGRLVTKEKVINHVDLWNQQSEPREDGSIEAFRFPAVFIEFPQTPWESLGKHKQQADLPINLYIVSEMTARSSSSDDTPAVRAEGVDHLKVCQWVYSQLHGWGGQALGVPFSTLKRNGFGYDHGHGTIVVHQMSFICTAQDSNAAPVLSEINTPPLEISDNLLPD